MANLVQNPYEIITDSNGDPLEDGYVFIGEPGLSPITNPLQAYWDSDLTVPATNIRTKGGYFSRAGSPGRLYTGTNYSILVQDKNGQTIYTQLDSVDYINSASGSTISSVATISDLRGILPVETNVQVSVGGSTTEGDGLMGPLYYWNASSSATDNGVSIIEPTASVGNGRWLWINTNAPIESVNISTSSTLDLAFKNRMFLVDTALAITSAVPDGDFQGQDIQIANRGASTLTITGTGIPSGTLVSDEVLLTWVGAVWSITDKGDTLSGDTITEYTSGSGVSVQASSGEQLLSTVYDIGTWDMDTVGDVSITHGLADHENIVDIRAWVIRDTVGTLYSIERTDSGSITVDSSDITLFRVASGFFDSANFSSTASSRGSVLVTHIV